MTRKVLFNDGLLLTTALIWGLAFVAQRQGMEFVGPFTFNGIRFFLGGAALLPLAIRSRSHFSAATVKLGMVAGLVLFVAASLQQVGLVYTTAGNAGFITGLYVVFVPVIGIGRAQRLGPTRWGAVATAVVGLYLLAVPAGFDLNPGDLLVLACAFFFAIHVQLVDHGVQRVEPLPFAIVQYSVVAVLSVVVAGITEGPPAAGSLGGAWIAIVYGGIGSISIAYTLQVVAQRVAPPAHAAILLSLEGVFAAIGGALILGEQLTHRGLAGCALVLAAMVVSQIGTIVRTPRAAVEQSGTTMPRRYRR